LAIRLYVGIMLFLSCNQECQKVLKLTPSTDPSHLHVFILFYPPSDYFEKGVLVQRQYLSHENHVIWYLLACCFL